MADNITLNPGTGGDTLAADDIGGVKHQRMKPVFGADGSATDVSTSTPLPVAAAGTTVTMSIAAGSGSRNSTAYDMYGCTNFMAQFTALGASGGGNIQLQFSPDGTTWTTAPGNIDYGNSGGFPNSAIPYSGLTTSLGTLYTGPMWNRYVRLFCSVTTTGTYTMAFTGTNGQTTPSRVIPQAITAPSGLTVVGGSYPTDSTLDTSGAVNVVGFNLGYVGGASANWVRIRTPNVFKGGTVNGTGGINLWAPGSGRRFRLMGYKITVPNNAVATAGPSVVDCTFYDNATALPFVESVYVNGAATNLQPGAYNSGAVDLGNGYLSTNANFTLKVFLSADLTSGSFRVTVWGTEE